VTFEGKGLQTNHPFRQAYKEAERFIELLSQRTRGAQLLRSVFLQRICSSFMSGRLTVERMLERRVDKTEDDAQTEMLEHGVLETLTDDEVECLEAIRDELTRKALVDPKLNAVRWFLNEFKSKTKWRIGDYCIKLIDFFQEIITKR
jgi:hypothetical protein